jgi:hypothetical protein
MVDEEGMQLQDATSSLPDDRTSVRTKTRPKIFGTYFENKIEVLQPFVVVRGEI